MLHQKELERIKLASKPDSSGHRINIDDFSNFTYAARWHWELFKDYDLELFGSALDLDRVDLKKYQDLLVFAFIKDHVKPGSRILDVGGGISRILNYFSDQYECWNIDKFEGLGNGPRTQKSGKYRLVSDYMGNFNTELPDNYFDLVFSISALEHVPQEDSVFLQNIIDDMDRVMKPGGYSLHLFDIVYKGGQLRVFNKFIYHVFTSVNTMNPFIHPNKVYSGYDLFFLSKLVYEDVWEKITKISFEDFGQPTSINALWQKK